MQQNIATLQEAAITFQQQGSVAGDLSIMNGLDNLERQGAKLQAVMCTEVAVCMRSSCIPADAGL